jgi:hypothetical protein
LSLSEDYCAPEPGAVVDELETESFNMAEVVDELGSVDVPLGELTAVEGEVEDEPVCKAGAGTVVVNSYFQQPLC